MRLLTSGALVARGGGGQRGTKLAENSENRQIDSDRATRSALLTCPLRPAVFLFRAHVFVSRPITELMCTVAWIANTYSGTSDWTIIPQAVGTNCPQLLHSRLVT